MSQEQRVTALVEELLSSTRIDQIALLDELVRFDSEEEVEAVFQYFLKSGERGISHIRWLVRYLVRVGKPYAYQKIIALAQSLSSRVRDEARGGLLKLNYEVRLELITAMLRSNYDREIGFAVEWLGEHGSVDAVEPLERIYLTHKDEGVQLRIVRALGKIHDESALIALERMLIDAEGRVERALLLSLSQLTESRFKKFVLNWLVADDPRLRSLASYKILGWRGRRWEHFVARELSSEERSEVKMQLLTAIVYVETRQLFNSLLEVALHDRSVRVRQMAHSVVHRLRSQRFLRWMLHFVHHCPEETLPRLMLLLAEYRTSQRVFSLFKKMYGQSAEPIIRLVSLQAMSYQGYPEAIDFMWKVALEEKQLRFAAVVGLMRLVSSDEPHWVVAEILGRIDQEEWRLAVQVVLHNLRAHASSSDLPKEYHATIEQLAGYDSGNTRYLAVRLIPFCVQAPQIDRLLQLTLDDPWAGIRRAAERGVRELILLHPHTLLKVLERGIARPRILSIVYRLVKIFPLHSLSLHDLVMAITTHFVNTETLVGAERSVGLRLMGILRELCIRHPAEMMQMVAERELEGPQLEFFMTVLNLTSIHRLPGLDIEGLLNRYEGASVGIKLQILRFVALFQGDLQGAKELVFHALGEEQDPQVISHLNQLVATWISQDTFFEGLIMRGMALEEGEAYV